MNRNEIGRVPDLHVGDILATRSRGFSPFSAIIRWKTEGPWNHVAIGYSGATVCEAMPRGVALNPTENYRAQWWVQLRWNSGLVAHALRDELERAMENRIGRKYDWAGVLGFSLFVPGNINNREKYFCSELACDVYRDVGLTLVKRRASGLVPPQDVVECPMLDVVDYQWPKKLMHWIEETDNTNPNDHTKFDHE